MPNDSMVLFEGTLGLGIALLLAVALAEMAKVRQKHEKAFEWLAVSGVLFLAANVFSLPAIFSITAQANTYLSQLFSALGKIAVIVSAVYLAIELFNIKKKK